MKCLQLCSGCNGEGVLVMDLYRETRSRVSWGGEVEFGCGGEVWIEGEEDSLVSCVLCVVLVCLQLLEF